MEPSIEELQHALQTVTSIIARCETAQRKFAFDSSQHTLLENRIKAMYLSKALLTKNIDRTVKIETHDTKAELIKSRQAVISILGKCEKTQRKFAAETACYARFNRLVCAMNSVKTLLTDKINESG